MQTCVPPKQLPPRGLMSSLQRMDLRCPMSAGIAGETSGYIVYFKSSRFALQWWSHQTSQH